MSEPELVLLKREVYYHEIEYVRNLEKLAKAILLFHKGTYWTPEDQKLWNTLVDNHEVTTKTLCDFARKILKSNS